MDDQKSPICPGLLPGSIIQVSIQYSESFRGICVGFDYGQCLIIKAPGQVYLGGLLNKKKHITIRYLHQGQVFGFQATLIGLISQPVKLAILSYPTTVEIINLRTAPRFACSLPVAINCYTEGSMSFNSVGLITDISAGGCSFSAAATRLDAECLKMGENVDLLFQVEEKGHEEHHYKILATIRLVRQDNDRVNLGLQFAEKHLQDEEGQQAYMAVLNLCHTLETAGAIRISR